MIANLLKQFDPDPDVLLRAISAHVTDEMLEAISMADYGMDSEEYLAALQQVRDTGTFPKDLVRFPMEALELIRWSEPEKPEWKPGRTGEFGHWMRAFSCAAILRAEHAPFSYSYNAGCTGATSIQLIWSLRSLPVDFRSMAAQNFSWLILNSEPEGQNDSICGYAVALLWFGLQLEPRVPDGEMVAFAEWLIRRADELNWEKSEYFSSLRKVVLDSTKEKAWELLGVELCDLDLSDRSTDLQNWVQLVGEQLTQ